MTISRPWALPPRAATAAAVALAMQAASAQTATEAALARKLDELAAELAAVKTQLADIRRERDEAKAAAATPAQPAAAVAAMPSVPAPTEPATVITSYGEVNYNRPTHQGQKAEADIRRFVLGYQHRFDEKTKVVTELEVEHAVSSASDPGEVDVEQAYIERQLTPTWAARAGLFLMPVGLLNENHEPTAFYGVERNFVETAIIPTTWREGGVQAIGGFDNGLTFQAGLTTSFDLTKWDAASTEGKDSPLGSIHQEMALAKGHDVAAFAALNWRGVPGLLVGGSVFTGNATQALASVTSRITLWDVHARWTPGRWDLSALYSGATISNTAALNAPLVGNPTLIPKSFDGWYVQSAYRLWQHEDYALAPFARYEQYNTARSYADLGPGLTPPSAPTEKVGTIGLNFQISPSVVLKADYQHFQVDPDLSRFDLGLGWSF